MMDVYIIKEQNKPKILVFLSFVIKAQGVLVTILKEEWPTKMTIL